MSNPQKTKKDQKVIKHDDSFCGNLTDLPSEKYKKFFATFDEIETLDVSLWRPSHILGYFCKKYKDTYNVPYQFKFNSPSPVKCFEVFQIKRLAMLLSSSPIILKGYIDWVYQTKVMQAKRKLTSISFMTNEKLVQDYKINVLLSDKENLRIDRRTLLPDYVREIILDENGTTLSTYGDLVFTHQAVLSNSFPDVFIKNWNVAMDKIQELGFDKEILERIV